jgi:hypothetical protein
MYAIFITLNRGFAALFAEKLCFSGTAHSYLAAVPPPRAA